MRCARAGVLFGVVLGAVLLATGCSPGTDDAGPRPTDPEVARLERLAADPAGVVATLREGAPDLAARARVTPDGGRAAYTFLVGQGSWRADLPGGDDRPTATVLRTGDRICFDRGFRPGVGQALASSYGVARFDPAPWTCTPAGFGLNTLLTHGLVRSDPRPRLAGLETDGATAEVEQVDGAPLLHLSATGVGADGPLDPARPAYDLWLTADLGLVRMTGDGTAWDLDRPADLAERLAPPAGPTGSYGYAVGPGVGSARACQQLGGCPDLADPASHLTWGDGRG
ncbi:hypothetical protein [Nocardioides abyssi]|uniref:Lipoprotein n=1 Tax=Nocardioides abyssi TaxID=3058370 RepID=A0ABT8EQ98_9ACTN|nr:hypothetical protein [Nocardioides abyssi]MDN4160322.1 hypothetical protein [Nocardioides abyssi]